MESKSILNRPQFTEALQAWQALLAKSGGPTDLLWLFDENLCFEKDPSRPGGVRLGFQTAFTPAPPEAERIAYEYFAEFEEPVVFYRIGTSGDKSVCLLLCDKWFEPKREPEGYVRREDWRVWFHPGPGNAVEQITERDRWDKRLLRERALHPLDFCMTLRAVHETLAHGRVLSTYERSALKLLHMWRRVFGQAGS
jgi:hypothetical protein